MIAEADQARPETAALPLQYRVIRALLLSFFAAAIWLCRRFYQLEISAKDRIPPTGPCIFVGNHSSKMDFWPTVFLKVVRPDVYLYGSGGARLWVSPLTKAMGAIPTFKGVGRSGPLLWSALKALQSGRSVGIAPEGEMEWDGRLLPFKPGVAWLALHSGAPIVVFVLKGGYSVWPRWASWPRLTGRLEIRIGEPFSISPPADGKITDDTIQDVNRRIAEAILKLQGNA